MAKDYYLILGLPLDAAPGEIRTAFHKLALRHHPDRPDASSPPRFQDIAEAYDVLSDPARRARYDRQLCRERVCADVVRVHARTRDPEPLIAEPFPITGRPETVRPSYGALLDRLVGNFLAAEAPKPEHPEPLNFELILSQEEAGRGVRIPFEIPVFSTCYRCGGTGRDWLFPCADCGGEGRFVDHEVLHVRVPAGVADGTVIERSLDRLGVHNLWLRVHVRVERH